MQSTVHQLDPNGDTLLTLENPNVPIVLQGSSFGLEHHALPQFNTSEIRLKERQAWLMSDESRTTTVVKIRLSSKHLTLASAYFLRLMAHDWAETTPADGYSFHASAEDWDEEALLTLMRIIHCQTTSVPSKIRLELLAKIAVLVDYYKCYEAVQFFGTIWIKNLPEPLPSSLGRNLILRFFVSWVFSDATTFQQLSRIIVQESRGPITIDSLPIPKSITDALDKRRQDIIKAIFSAINTLKTQLCGNESRCVFECSSITLGALMRGLQSMAVLNPLPRPPFYGLSIVNLSEAIQKMKSPEYGSIRHQLSFEYNSGPCNLTAKVKSVIEEQLQKVHGLDVRDFVGVEVKERTLGNG